MGSLSFEQLVYGKPLGEPGGEVLGDEEHQRLGFSPGFPSPRSRAWLPSNHGPRAGSKKSLTEPGSVFRPIGLNGGVRPVFVHAELRREGARNRAYTHARYLAAPSVHPDGRNAVEPSRLFATNRSESSLGLTLVQGAALSALPARPALLDVVPAWLDEARVYVLSGTGVAISSEGLDEASFWAAADALWRSLPSSLRAWFSAGWNVRGSQLGDLTLVATGDDHALLARVDRHGSVQPPRTVRAGRGTRPFQQGWLDPGRAMAGIEGAPDVQLPRATGDGPVDLAHTETRRRFRRPGLVVADSQSERRFEAWLAGQAVPTDGLVSFADPKRRDNAIRRLVHSIEEGGRADLVHFLWSLDRLPGDSGLVRLVRCRQAGPVLAALECLPVDLRERALPDGPLDGLEGQLDVLLSNCSQTLLPFVELLSQGGPPRLKLWAETRATGVLACLALHTTLALAAGLMECMDAGPLARTLFSEDTCGPEGLPLPHVSEVPALTRYLEHVALACLPSSDQAWTWLSTLDLDPREPVLRAALGLPVPRSESAAIAEGVGSSPPGSSRALARFLLERWDVFHVHPRGDWQGVLRWWPRDLAEALLGYRGPFEAGTLSPSEVRVGAAALELALLQVDEGVSEGAASALRQLCMRAPPSSAAPTASLIAGLLRGEFTVPRPGGHAMEVAARVCLGMDTGALWTRVRTRDHLELLTRLRPHDPRGLTPLAWQVLAESPDFLAQRQLWVASLPAAWRSTFSAYCAALGSQPGDVGPAAGTWLALAFEEARPGDLPAPAPEVLALFGDPWVVLERLLRRGPSARFRREARDAFLVPSFRAAGLDSEATSVVLGSRSNRREWGLWLTALIPGGLTAWGLADIPASLGMLGFAHDPANVASFALLFAGSVWGLWLLGLWAASRRSVYVESGSAPVEVASRPGACTVRLGPSVRAALRAWEASPT